MMPLMLIMMRQVADQKEVKKAQQTKANKEAKRLPSHVKISCKEETEDVKPLMAEDAISRISGYDGPFQYNTTTNNQNTPEKHIEDTLYTRNHDSNKEQETDKVTELWMFVKTPCFSGSIYCTLVRHKRDKGCTLYLNKEGYKTALLVSKYKTTTTHVISMDQLDTTEKSGGWTATLKSNIFGTCYSLCESDLSLNLKAQEIAAIMCHTNVLGLGKQKKISVVVPYPQGDRQQYLKTNGSLDVRITKSNFLFQNALNCSNKGNNMCFSNKGVRTSEKTFSLVDERCGQNVMNFGRLDENVFSLDYSYPLCATQAFGIALANLLTK